MVVSFLGSLKDAMTNSSTVPEEKEREEVPEEAVMRHGDVKWITPTAVRCFWASYRWSS